MSKFVQSKDVAWNYLGEKIIAFNLSGERHFHDLNETAATIFRELQVPRSKSEVVEAMIAEFDVDPAAASTDVEELIADMKSKRLITEA